MMIKRNLGAPSECGQRHIACIVSCSIGLMLLVSSSVGCRNAGVLHDPKSNEDSMNPSIDTTTKVYERDSDKDGKPEFRVEKFYRGEEMVMMTTSRLNADGVMAIASRSYLVAGRQVLTEGDDDGDGFFETIMATDPETRDIEMFDRKTDGSVRPASSKVVEAHKKMIGAVADFFDEMANTNATPANLDDDIIGERIRATQQKIQDAHKEIADDKK